MKSFKNWLFNFSFRSIVIKLVVGLGLLVIGVSLSPIIREYFSLTSENIVKENNDSLEQYYRSDKTQALLSSWEAFEAYSSKKYKKAFSIWQPLAEQGDAESQFYLANMYYNGEGVPQNDNEALKWYYKAAEQEHASAQYSLAILYQKGDRVPQNYVEAINWYRKAAKQGFRLAQYTLAEIYSRKQSDFQNYIQAYMWASIAKANDSGKGEKLLRSLVKQMTLADITAAQQLAKECWESNYQNCGE